jgi:aspartate kinase
VLKFGGTSVKDAKMFHRAASIVAGYTGERVVVLSAMTGVTNELVSITNGRLGEREVEGCLKKLRARHITVVDSISEPSIREEVGQALDAKFEKLVRLCRGVAMLGDITPRVRDQVHSYGERLSVILLAGVLRDKGVDALVLESDSVGMLTDGVFGSASPLLDEIEKAFSGSILPKLKKGIVPVVTGFFGADPQGNATTFGRGGSDFSAAIVAHALDADACEIWTDVDGFMTADPRFVPDAKVIASMNYNESAELAYFGAKVLHPRTVEPARKKKIPILVKNTFRPDAQGTKIWDGGNGDQEKKLVRSVASKGGLAVVKIFSPEMAYQPEFVSKVLGALGRRGINAYAISTSLATFSILTDASSIAPCHETLDSLENVPIEKVVVQDGISLICVVGERMSEHGVAAKIFTTVASTGTSLIMISEGASDVALNFAIAQEREGEVVRTLHREYVENGGGPR